MENKPVTIKVIAKKLNISISAVSKALHDDPSIGLRTKMRVKALANELNYQPNQIAIDLQKGRTNTIGVILPHLSETFFPELISGIEQVASDNDYVVLFGQSNEDPAKEQMLINWSAGNRVVGSQYVELLINFQKRNGFFNDYNNTTLFDFGRRSPWPSN